MTTRIRNGGAELGLLQLADKDNVLSESDQARMEYLESLPKNQNIYLDENGMAMSEVELTKARKNQSQRFGLNRATK